MVSIFFQWRDRLKTGNTYFMAKTAQKPYRLGPHIPICRLYRGVPLWEGGGGLMQRGPSFYEITSNDSEINI